MEVVDREDEAALVANSLERQDGAKEAPLRGVEIAVVDGGLHVGQAREQSIERRRSDLREAQEGLLTDLCDQTGKRLDDGAIRVAPAPTWMQSPPMTVQPRSRERRSNSRSRRDLPMPASPISDERQRRIGLGAAQGMVEALELRALPTNGVEFGRAITLALSRLHVRCRRGDVVFRRAVAQRSWASRSATRDGA